MSKTLWFTFPEGHGDDALLAIATEVIHQMHFRVTGRTVPATPQMDAVVRYYAEMMVFEKRPLLLHRPPSLPGDFCMETLPKEKKVFLPTLLD